MKKERLHLLFKKYLDRRCSPEEIKELLGYFKLDADRSGLKILVESELERSVSLEADTEKLNVMYERVGHKLNAHLISETEEIETLPFYKKYKLLAAAAILTGILIFASLQREAIRNLLDPVRYNELTTKPTERKLISLTDGSRIWLSPATKLRYPDKFRGGTREVSISGQAFFEVAHDRHHPFIVRSGKLETRVLGTSFNIAAYTSEKNVEVTLLTGKVRVSLNKEKIEINPNQRVVYSGIDGVLKKEEDPDAQRFIEQREGILNYKGTPLLTVIKDLERTFLIKVDLDTRLKDCLFIGSFKATDRPEIAIQQIVLSFNVKYKKVAAGAYKITGKSCRSI